MTDIEKKVIENYIEDNQYIEQIDKYYNKSLDRNKPIFIGKTSNALSISGAKQDLDIMINPSTLDKCVGKPTEIFHGHELDKSIIKQISLQLRNPVLILKNEEKNSLIAITNLKDNNNRKIIIAIELNKKIQHHMINRISSIYGRENFNKYLNTQIKKGNLIAYNKEKADKLFQSVGLRLPSEETIISYDDSISYTTENVKYPTKERSEIMQEKIKENINFPEIIAHDEFIKTTPVKDVNQLGWNEKNIKELSEKTPTKYTTHHIQNNLNQELDKNKAYEIPQNNIINIENNISSNSDIINMLTQMVEQNDNHAKIQLALAYYFGEYGLEKNGDKAVELLADAAGEGSAVAQRDLAIILENTEPKDQQKAIEYYKMAVDNENPDAYALNNLGVCYLTGDGVEVDYKKAVELFKKAAELGDDYAKLNLADNYYLGIGTRQSFEKAFELYKEVAENGNVTALKYLGECYEAGKGTEVNYKLALECYQKAIEKGDEDAKYKYAELSNKISPHKHTYVDNSLKQTIQKQQENTQEQTEQKQQEQTENKTEKQPLEETLKNKTEEAQEHKEKAKNKAKQTKTKNEPEL